MARRDAEKCDSISIIGRGQRRPNEPLFGHGGASSRFGFNFGLGFVLGCECILLTWVLRVVIYIALLK